MQFLITDDDVPVARFKDATKRMQCLEYLREKYPERDLKPLDIPDTAPVQQKLL